jgi:cystathionine beta-lyase
MDFDKIIDRKGTNCLKYDFTAERGKPEGVLPFWVADMDFQTAPLIQERLAQAVSHGIFGYSEGKDDYFAAIANWYQTHFGWEVKRNWLVKTPGVVFALAMAVKAFTKEGEGVLIQQPVYYPFSEVILDNNRKLVNSPLKNMDGHYEIDFEDFEQKIIENQVKLFLMCSPHNPVGRVWEKWELQKIGEICLKYGVIVVSDEIHSDFVWEDHKHIIFASLSPELADITVTCTAPSKTFNIAGLQISNIFISNQKLRRRFRHEVSAAGYSQVNGLGLVACQAAYEGGEEWLSQLKKYIWHNYIYLKEFLKEKAPKLKVGTLEGTYLVWIDFRELGMTEAQREDLLVNRAKLWLDSGAMFGEDGEGYERINIACPRSVLRKALEQLVECILVNDVTPTFKK